MKSLFLSVLTLAAGIAPVSATTVSTPANGAQVASPFNLVASTSSCQSKPAVSMGYSVDSGPTTIESTNFNVMVTAAVGSHVLHVKCWGALVHDDAPLNITVVGTATTPTFSLASGAYTSVQSVTLSDSTPGAILYYTTDGTTPSPSSNRYTGAIQVATTETISVIAVASGYSNSAAASAVYTVTLTAATPAFSVPAGTYTSVQSVALFSATPGAILYYTMDGTAPTPGSNRYAGAISVANNETVNAIAIASGYANSNIASAAYTVTLITAPPTFSVAAGTYTSAQSVTLSSNTPGASIYYTTDGTAPTTSSLRYAGAISVGSTETINAIAVATSYANSGIASAAYTVTPAATPPAFSLSSGTYTSVQSVTLSDSTPGATLYYTTNGTAPTSSSTRYTGALSVTVSETINAIAIASNYSNSAIASVAYTVTLPAAPPTFSLASGAYTSAQSVTLSDSTAGATLYYTTDGTAPSVSSNRYTGAIQVATTETINAIAVASGYSNSAAASATYTVMLTAATPAFSVPAGTYTSTQSVTLSSATPGAILYYTMDGTAPTAASYRYVNAIPVASTETINAISIAPGYSNSTIASAAYTLTLPVATPAFSVAAGTYTSAQLVTLSDATSGATIHYTLNGAQPTSSSPPYTGAISVGASETIMAMAMAPGHSNSGMASAVYTIKSSAAGPVVPDDAISATSLQIDSRWKFNHDAGTPGTSVGTKIAISDPSLSGEAAEFDNTYTNWGGEIYHLSYGTDAEASNFVYDAQIWIAKGSQIGNLEMDMNQVIPDGDTVIYGFQCDGDHGTWDYSGNTGAISVSHISWMHSKAPCNPAKWTPNAWHHIQISYSRDEVGNVTYQSVWLDGVAAPINVTVPSAQALAWAHGDLLTNFQIDGVGASGASVLYLDNLTISRW